MDNLNDMMARDWNLINSDAHHGINNPSANHLSNAHSLSRKISDQINSNNRHSNNHHQQSIHNPPMITTTDYSNRSSLGIMPNSDGLFTRRRLETGYDTDGAIGTTKSILTPHHKTSHGYEHLVSPRLPSRRSVHKPSMKVPVIPHRQHSPHHAHLTVNPSSVTREHHDDNDAETMHEDGGRRRHIRLSRRIPARSPTAKTHGNHSAHPSTIPRDDRVFATSSTHRPFKLVFMRHSERANQALGPDWFSKAFRTNTYRAYDKNLPPALPKRRSDQAYEFDVPLTVRGLKNARHTGEAMANNNLQADLCLSSTALRCIQTAERVLKGMNRSEQVPIRIEPGLFECPHVSYKTIESFMTKKELIDNGYNVNPNYEPLIQKVNVPEALEEYFDRCVIVMRGIIDRYAGRGGTILIITHAPGLLALTHAINGIRPNAETFYRTVATYPPLAFYVAEYNGTKWEHSEQPFSIPSPEQ